MQTYTHPNKELVRHGEILFPIKMYYSVVGNYVDNVHLHWHEELEFIHIKKGAGTFYLDFKPVAVEGETVLVINPGTLHSGITTSYMDCETLVFNLHTLMAKHTEILELTYILPLLHQEVGLDQVHRPGSNHFQDLTKLLNRLSDLHQDQTPGYELMVKATLFELLHLFYKEDLLTHKEDHGQDKEKFQRIAKILEYIEGHYTKPITLKDIAHHVGLSDHYFCHFFKDTTGSTFKDYLNRYRIQQASELLQTTEKEIIDIATLCGFDNLSYFYRVFKKHKGTTPVRFRKQA